MFVDEGKRSDYMLCAAVVPSADIAQARAAVRAMKPGNKSRIHMQGEQRASRQRILSEFCRTPPIQEAHLWILGIGHRPERDVRDDCFRQLVPGVVELGARRIVVESCSQDEQDLRVMTSTLAKLGALDQTRAEILPAKAHELLWAADIVAWSYEAGGEFRKKIQDMVTVHKIR